MQINVNCVGFPDGDTCLSSVADKMGIKTTVHEIVAAKQNLSIPDPERHADFIKCKCCGVFLETPGRTVRFVRATLVRDSLS